MFPRAGFVNLLMPQSSSVTKTEVEGPRIVNCGFRGHSPQSSDWGSMLRKGKGLFWGLVPWACTPPCPVLGVPTALCHLIEHHTGERPSPLPQTEHQLRGTTAPGGGHSYPAGLLLLKKVTRGSAVSSPWTDILRNHQNFISLFRL